MSKFKKGQRVSWVKKMAVVPHPEGKTDRHGEVLPVFRDKEMDGTVISACSKGWIVRPDFAKSLHKDMERYYDIVVEESNLKLI